LIVRATGKIVGKIHYAEIEIEKGGEIEGALNQGSEPPAAASTGASHQAVDAPSMVSSCVFCLTLL